MTDELIIRDEEILLLGLSRLAFPGDLTGKISDLVKRINDWDYFSGLANEHGIAALAGLNLERLGLSGNVPEKAYSVLRNALMMSISRNAFHLSSIEELLALFNKEGIKVILLKGLALELTIYGNSGLRQMTDVDILVDKDQYLRARNILMQFGYDSMPVKSGFHRPIMAWTGKHLPAMLKNGTSVDIHIELFAGKKNKLTKVLIDTSSEINVDREKAWIPSPQLHFLFLVKHLYSHELSNESQLRLYTDLVVLLEGHYEEIINEGLIDNAAKAGLSKILAWKLEPLRDLWGISFPAWLNDFIDKRFNPGTINSFVFFLKSPKNNPPRGKALAYRYKIKEIPGIHRKVLFLLGDIFPSLSFMKERYKCKSGFKALFYYPHRFGKIFWLFRRG